ncbi:hypothetical protein AJ88_46220 [Mesorhizobium amorphae CCBAU 01583]|nr:hypothetical protein AJ88_46220 [Mesorhizobium amorphae CCBAU 01583]
MEQELRCADSTYVILGERGSRCCILNGAAARTCQPDDQITVCSSIYLDEAHITSLKPRIVSSTRTTTYSTA